MSNIPPLKDYINEANKVWEKMSKFLPFTDKDAYITYIKTKYKEMAGMSNGEFKKYSKQQEDLIKEGLRRLESSEKIDAGVKKFVEKGEHPND